MKYLINRENFRQFDISEINKLPGRAYFIPYSDKSALTAQTPITERYNSSMVHILNGEWDFKYYDKDMLIPNEFYSERIQFDKVTVPSTWQRTGYREPCYLNTRYEFDPTLYPEMPQDVPMGVYRKFITVENTDKVHIITFLGVISSLDLYVNGSFVGYSEGAHNSAEFDISKYLIKGENEIIAVVSKWSTGTYLECQDMFRENGIFRDVYLTELDNTYIYDYHTETVKRDGKYDMTVFADIMGDTAGYTLSVELVDNGKVIAASETQAVSKTTVSFEALNVTEWNAEEPYIYELYITLKKNGETVSVLRNITGFKTVEIKGNVFYFNDKPIKFKGVNHHDTDMHGGYVLTGEKIKNELELMKKFNINAIRTSHYPPDPMLLTLADIMGFYIVDEADIETHGASNCSKTATEHLISNDLKWVNRYLDRVSRMYYRDRSHPSITMWSLGNEAGGYKCQDECYKFLKDEKSPIPVHYEGVIRTKRAGYDVISEMYPTQEHVSRVGKLTALERYRKKPYFMCEYVHAMGVGPGGAEEYWQSIYAHDNLMGGCVWEWADHAVYHADGDKKYPYRYTYGGDHGEEKHDSNFCVDGMLYPDKTPHTGAYVIKAIYRPVRSEYISGKCFSFTNTNRFKNSKYLNVIWTQLINGVEHKSGTLTLDIEPMQSKTYEIPYDEYDKNGDCHINIAYYDGDHRCALEQTVLCDNASFAAKSTVGNVEISDKNGILTVGFNGGKLAFDKNSGEMVSYFKNGCEFLNICPADGKKGFIPNLTRASLDNDSFGFPKLWAVIKLNEAKLELKEFKYADYSAYAVIAQSYTVKKGFKNYFHVNLTYTVHGDGLVNVTASLTKAMFGSLEIQRFGLMAELSPQLTDMEFYGRGSDEKMENLCDMKDHATVGVYKTTVADMHEPYVMPQDNGNCGGVKYLKLSDRDGNTFCVYGEPKFSFSAHDYTQSALDKAKHQEELVRENTTVLSVDGFMRGTGTNTCGPDTLSKYKVKTDKPLTFKFSFKAE
ncbi:MAG: hypothetical protein J1F23_02545 [Oscillospiraceae bacterium]|nr:hypothetical protein [Oscillospiraceae bacterium]